MIVRDADAHRAQAKAAGAAIVLDNIADLDYGGKGYSCRDIDVHLWWFDNYDPWKAEARSPVPPSLPCTAVGAR